MDFSGFMNAVLHASIPNGKFTPLVYFMYTSGKWRLF